MYVNIVLFGYYCFALLKTLLKIMSVKKLALFCLCIQLLFISCSKDTNGITTDPKIKNKAFLEGKEYSLPNAYISKGSDGDNGTNAWYLAISNLTSNEYESDSLTRMSVNSIELTLYSDSVGTGIEQGSYEFTDDSRIAFSFTEAIIVLNANIESGELSGFGENGAFEIAPTGGFINYTKRSGRDLLTYEILFGDRKVEGVFEGALVYSTTQESSNL